MLSVGRLLTAGLLCMLSTPAAVVSVAIPAQQDVVVNTRSAIAVKLHPSTLQARSDLTGAQLVESLVRKSQNSNLKAKRNTDFEVLPLITSISPEEVDDMVRRAAERDPTYEPVNFRNWFQVRFADPHSDMPQLLGDLDAHEAIASCHPLSSVKAPAVQPSDDPRYPEQRHLAAAPEGIDASYAWGFPGGDGAGTSLVDVERGWLLDHEDLAAANITLVAGDNVRDRLNGNLPHGTAVLGTMFMVDNGIGGVGVVPNAKGYVVGTQRTVNGGRQDNEPEAILDGARFLKPGDVMLLEMQAIDVNTILYPIEILDAQYDAIRLATGMGIIVIEPAGNGDQVSTSANLDEPFIRYEETTPHSYLNPASPEFRDSGAILVAAATAATPHKKMPWSGYGSRIDVYAFGEKILTTGVVPQENDRNTYVEFAGTSGAAPIIAGAALSIQGMLNANGRPKLTPSEMRSLIKIGGTPSENPSADKIGVQPNLKAIIDGGHVQ